MHKIFRVVALSDNMNAFGLRQFYAFARDGQVIKACANSLNLPKVGQDINVPYTINGMGEVHLKGAELGYELFQIHENRPPEELLWEAFPDMKDTPIKDTDKGFNNNKVNVK